MYVKIDVLYLLLVFIFTVAGGNNIYIFICEHFQHSARGNFRMLAVTTCVIFYLVST